MVIFDAVPLYFFLYLHTHRSGCPNSLPGRLEDGPSLPERTELSVDTIVGLLTMYLDTALVSLKGRCTDKNMVLQWDHGYLCLLTTLLIVNTKHVLVCGQGNIFNMVRWGSIVVPAFILYQH